VPQLLNGKHAGRSTPPLAVAPTPTSIQPSASQTASNTVAPSTHGSAPIQRPPQRTTLSTSWTVPPPGFEPTSVTFVGTGKSTVIGAVIGQAAHPCASQFCTSLAGTSTYGSSWYGVSAPYAPGPNGSAGVSQLRFADLSHGWAFGPALYATNRGGASWYPEGTGGQRVIDIEAAANGPALGLFATCTGAGSAYAANCTSFTLNTSVAGSRTWTPVTVPAGTMATGQAASAELVVTGTTGYVLTPTGAVVTGPVSGGTWQLAGQAPCAPGPAQRSGLPSRALLATSPGELMVVCANNGTTPALSTSTNGSAWNLIGSVPLTGSVASLASGTAGQVVVATSTGIYRSSDAGRTWRAAAVTGGTPVQGFSYVGMTTPAKGVAVPVDAALGVLYVTTDGGLHWRQSPITG
jgi:hypothetical protein